MTTYPTPVKIAAKPLHDALRLQTVLTIETVEAALHEHVYRLWEARGMFCPDPDAHETVSEFARPMLRALPDAAIDRRTEAGL